MLSGVIDPVREIAAEVGINAKRSISPRGIRGRTDLLAPADIREFTTMCGHGVVSPLRVRDIIRRVKTGKVTEWEGSIILAEPCVCGFYNPCRSVELSGERRPSARSIAGSIIRPLVVAAPTMRDNPHGLPHNYCAPATSIWGLS